MKKIALILLICFYALSCFGIGINQSFCCGELKSISVTFAEIQNEKSGKENKKSDCCECAKKGKKNCCKQKHQFFKLKGNYFATDNLTIPGKYVTGLYTFTYFPEIILFADQQLSAADSNHPPPLHPAVPIYIIHCAYLI